MATLREKLWRGFLWLAIVLVVGSMALELIQDERLSQPVEPGSPAPELTGPRLGGGTFSLGETRGKTTIVAFWATWCGACVEEMPLLLALEREYASQGVQLVAASLDGPGSARTVSSLLKRLGGEPVVLFPRDDVARAWKARRLPTVYVVGPDGKIVGGVSGMASERWLRRTLESARGR